jgi:hypothetical protein
LVQNHANLTIKDAQGETPLAEATKANQAEVVKILSQTTLTEPSPKVPGSPSGDMPESTEKSQVLKINDVLQMGNSDVLHHGESTALVNHPAPMQTPTQIVPEMQIHVEVV